MTLTQIQRDDLRVITNDSLQEFGPADWSILDDRRGDLPEFPSGVFTDSLRTYLERAALVRA